MKRVIELVDKDCAIIMRSNGQVEISIKPRKPTDRVDLIDTEVFLIALHSLMHDEKWIKKVLDYDYPNFKINAKEMLCQRKI